MSRRVSSTSRYILPSGGGGGGGVSLFDLPLEEINVTDGSWTLLDPDSLIKSVSFSGGFHTVTWNALPGTSNVDYNWTSGTTIRAPRWYKTLQVDGNTTTEDNLQVVLTRIEQTTPNDFNSRVVFGIATDPTSTTLITINGSGGSASRIGTGNRNYGTWQVNSQSELGVSDPDFGLAAVMRGFRATGGGVFITVDDDVSPPLFKAQGTRPSNRSVASATVQKMIVGIGVRSNTDSIEEDDQQKFKLSIRSVVYGGLT